MGQHEHYISNLQPPVFHEPSRRRVAHLSSSHLLFGDSLRIFILYTYQRRGFLVLCVAAPLLLTQLDGRLFRKLHRRSSDERISTAIAVHPLYVPQSVCDDEHLKNEF
jgi:hypothetical protein